MMQDVLSVLVLLQFTSFIKSSAGTGGETRLVRVDICSTKGGVLVVSMSHQAGGFAPYRLDNCSTEVLHVR